MHKQHFTEDDLDIFVRFPEQLTEAERNEIALYISRDTLAQEYVALRRKFYEEFEKTFQEPPAREEKEFADSLFPKKQFFLPSLGLTHTTKREIASPIFEIIDERRTIPQRIINFIRIYPIRTASIATMFAGMLFIGILSLKNIVVTDSNPTFARILNGTLFVYNKTSDILWLKVVTGMGDVSANDQFDTNIQEKRVLLVADIDGDRTNEVLITGPSSESTFKDDTLYCFDSWGNVKWKKGFYGNYGHSEIRFPKWRTVNFFTVESSRWNAPKLFVIVMNSFSFYCRIVELSAVDGGEVQSYLHYGGLGQVSVKDLDTDGKPDLIFGGINNIFSSAVVVVLEAEKIGGVSPNKPDALSDSMTRYEKFYAVFGQSNMGKELSERPYNIIGSILVQIDNSIIVRVTEIVAKNPRGTLIYTLTPDFILTNITMGDDFTKLHQKWVRSKKIAPPNHNELNKEMRQLVKVYRYSAPRPPA